MAQNSKHFIFLTVLWTRNADRVWLDGWSLLQDVWGVTEPILTAEAGNLRWVFTQRSDTSMTSHLVSLTNKVSLTSFISAQDSKRKEVWMPALIWLSSGPAQHHLASNSNQWQHRLYSEEPAFLQREGVMTAEFNTCSQVHYSISSHIFFFFKISRSSYMFFHHMMLRNFKSNWNPSTTSPPCTHTHSIFLGFFCMYLRNKSWIFKN